MKIRPVRAELFHADGRTDGRTDRQTDRQTDGRTDGQYTDMTKLTVAFCNSAKASKNYRLLVNVDGSVAVDYVTMLFFTCDYVYSRLNYSVISNCLKIGTVFPVS